MNYETSHSSGRNHFTLHTPTRLPDHDHPFPERAVFLGTYISVVLVWESPLPSSVYTVPVTLDTWHLFYPDQSFRSSSGVARNVRTTPQRKEWDPRTLGVKFVSHYVSSLRRLATSPDRTYFPPVNLRRSHPVLCLLSRNLIQLSSTLFLSDLQPRWDVFCFTVTNRSKGGKETSGSRFAHMTESYSGPERFGPHRTSVQTTDKRGLIPGLGWTTRDGSRRVVEWGRRGFNGERIISRSKVFFPKITLILSETSRWLIRTRTKTLDS